MLTYMTLTRAIQSAKSVTVPSQRNSFPLMQDILLKNITRKPINQIFQKRPSGRTVECLNGYCVVRRMRLKIVHLVMQAPYSQ